mgnify:CR=1 FL=1
MMHRNIIIILCALFLAACQPAKPATATVFAPAIQTAAAVSANAEMTQTAAPSLTPSPTVTRINSPTVTLTPTITATFTPSPTSPTVGDLLNASAFVENLEALNGHSMQKITGWDKGFVGKYRSESVTSSYQWLDSNHLLLHARIGRQKSPIPRDITAPAVVNLKTAKFWTPMMDEYWNDWHYLPRWSAKLGILITGQGDEIFAYNPDGEIVKTYKGRLFGVSPSGTKILVDDDTWIDLSSGKTVDFGWIIDSWQDKNARPIWSPNEKRVWRCCYHYGDADTGKGLDIRNITVDGQSVPGFINATLGRWLGNDYFLPESAWADQHPFYSLGFIPIFDPAAKTFRNLVEYAGLPANFNNPELSPHIQISPEGDSLTVSSPYLASLSAGTREYVLDLKTLQIKLYRVESYTVSESGEITSKTQVFSPSGEEIQPTPTHTTKIVLPILTTQRFLSPNGSRIALLSVDGSLWLVDYPSLENLEQLTEPMPPKILPSGAREPRIKDISWSPDSRYLAFLGDKNIYIVDTRATP